MNPPATARLTVCRAADPARGAAVALLGLLVSIAAILGWRRAAGAIVLPLDLPGLLVSALLVATCAAGARLAWLSAASGASAGSRRAASRVDIAFAASVSLVVLALGLLVCLPGTTVAGRLVLWIALTAEELFSWRLLVSPGAETSVAFRSAKQRGFRGAKGDNPTDIDSPVLSPGGDAGMTLSVAAAGLPSSARPGQSPPAGIPAEEVLQQLTRSRTADGGELLSGWLRVDLAAGQRTANLHVAFCPPFARAPRISVQQIGGPEARVKTAQSLPYGVRFDVKVAEEGSEASILLLQFAATVAGEAG